MTAVSQPSAPVIPAPPRRRRSRRRFTRGERKNIRTGLLFISPWLVGFVLFTLYPAVASLYYSFTNFKILQTPRWIGLDNYANLLKDPLFWKSMSNTLFLTVVGVPLAIGVALGIALLLNNRRVRGLGAFRTVFYLPVVIPAVAASLLWVFLLNPSIGLLNQGLGAVGVDGPGWFFDPAWAKNGLVLLMVWSAGDVVIIYLSALQGGNRQLYEAAEVDGAGSWVKLRHVTIPMISPAILFNLIVGAIAAFQAFTQAFVIGNGTVSAANDASIGGIQNSMLLYGLHLYNTAFRYFQMGYGSALAWVLLVAILLATLVMLRVSKDRVYYESGR